MSASLDGGGARGPRWLERFGLGRRELRAWVLYDWANSAFFTTVVAAVFPIYFHDVVAEGREDVVGSYTRITSASLLVIAALGPILGAIADGTARKKQFLALFMLLGIAGTASLFFAERGDVALATLGFALGNVGVAGSFVFYDALLPEIARADELDRVSSAGYALGYLGGGVLLALNLAWILSPETFGFEPGTTLPTRLAFLSVALWWLVFALPLFLVVRERAAHVARGESALARGLRHLRDTLGHLRRWRHAFLLMLAVLVYGDGINTIIRMATIYGAELGIDRSALVKAILLVQFTGFPCAFLFGALASKLGAKRAIMVGLVVYFGICFLAWRMSTAAEFYALALLVGLVQGGCQALSRSLFASLVPRRKAAEFFGLFGVLERFSSVLGPLAFGLARDWTGVSRAGVAPIALFFAAGLWLLAKVDVEAGQRAAREADAEP